MSNSTSTEYSGPRSPPPVLAACKSGGLLPFANFNRIHAVPPCNVTDDEVAEGLRILDAALNVADEHCV